MKKETVVGIATHGDYALLVEKIGQLNGPGGKVKEGESIYSAMAREFEEATGLPTETGRWTCFLVREFETERVFFLELGPDCALASAVSISEPVKLYRWRDADTQKKMVFDLNWVIPLALYHRTEYPVVLTEWKET